MHGKTYPGSYEDPGTTVSATWLHPGARSSGMTLVEIIHVMRTMEYGDAHDEPIVFRRLVLALWVLYCSGAELELPLQDVSEFEPEMEFEAETVSEYATFSSHQSFLRSCTACIACAARTTFLRRENMRGALFEVWPADVP